VSKNMKKIIEDWVSSQNYFMGDLNLFYLLFKEKIMFKSH
jgi:hypothetical protein